MLYQGDCLEILPTLEANSIQCVVTSPPYWGLRDYGCAGQLGLEKTPEEYVANLVRVFQEVKRVLRDDGTLWLNLGDSYASFRDGKATPDTTRGDSNGTLVPKGMASNRMASTFSGSPIKHKDLVGIPWRVAFALQADGWWLRQDIIWSKPNPMPESVSDRCTKSHEYIFLLTKAARYFYDHVAVMEPVKESSIARLSQPNLESQVGSDRVPFKTNGNMKAVGRLPRKHDGLDTGGNGSAIRDHVGNSLNREDGQRNRRSVWTITTKPFNMWNETSRLSRVERDAVSCGMKHIVLPVCPVHGYLCHQDSNRSGGERGADATNRIEGNGDLVQSPLFDCAPIDQNPAGDSSPGNSGLPPLACFPSATDHNTGKSKTVLVPETMPSCTPCGENEPRTDGTQVPPLSFAQHPCMNGSNKWPDEMDVHLPDQTTFRTVDSLSLPIPPECLCGYYHTVTKKSSHFATFPPEIPEICIKAGSRVGDTVLDPFAGAGTTGMIAEKLDRKFIGIELNPEYAKMGERRIEAAELPLFANLSTVGQGNHSTKGRVKDEKMPDLCN
jgi:DNA modification methylase